MHIIIRITMGKHRFFFFFLIGQERLNLGKTLILGNLLYVK